MLVFKCKKHPTYTGSIRPQEDCKACEQLYALVKTAQASGLEVGIIVTQAEAERMPPDEVRRSSGRRTKR